MKMKTEHYQELKNYVLSAFKEAGKSVNEVRQEYNDKGLSEKRFLWDVFYATKVMQWGNFKTLYDNLDYLHDPHIETALRKIIKEAA